MWSRRRFLTRSGLGLLGSAGACFAFPGDAARTEDRPGGGGAAGPPRPIPDGSASRNLITPQTDRTIQRGLAFLASRRMADGSFGTRGYRGNVAVTSLASLAFMAGGHQPNRGAYGRVVTDALKFVLSKENVNGTQPGYLHNPLASPHGPMYGHGFATLFLAEAYGMVHERALRNEMRGKLSRAVKLIVDSQNFEGGWRYTPRSHDADISVTICQVMALRAAKNAGFSVPKGTIDRCVKYVKACQYLPEGWFRYMKQGGGGPHQGFARTAAGVVALFSAGIYDGREVKAGLQYLMRHKPGGGFLARLDMHYFYGHYYAVQAMWTAGEPYWRSWYESIRDELLARQGPDGAWMDPICVHYGTAMACIILQVPNNYLPILQK